MKLLWLFNKQHTYIERISEDHSENDKPDLLSAKISVKRDCMISKKSSVSRKRKSDTPYQQDKKVFDLTKTRLHMWINLELFSKSQMITGK